MRRAEALAALLLLLLAGCAEPAPPPRVESDEPNALQPGLWSVTRAPLSQQVGEGPADMSMTATPKTETKCLAEPVTRIAAAEFLLDVEGAACTPGALTFHDGKLTATLSCTPPPTHSSNRMSASGSFDQDSFSVEVEQAAVGIPPTQSSQTRTAVDGRRVGDC